MAWAHGKKTPGRDCVKKYNFFCEICRSLWKVAKFAAANNCDVPSPCCIYRFLLQALRKNGCEDLAESIVATPVEGDPTIRAKCKLIFICKCLLVCCYIICSKVKVVQFVDFEIFPFFLNFSMHTKGNMDRPACYGLRLKIIYLLMI